MSQKSAIFAAIAVLVGLVIMTSVSAKPLGDKNNRHTDVYTISATANSEGGGEDSGDSQDTDEGGVPVIIVIDIDQVVEEDDAI